MRALAVDDEPLALSVIETFAKQIPVISHLDTLSSSIDALAYLDENEVDLVFLDINMPKLSGIEFAKLIPPTTMVIFTTAYEQYALNGFDLNAVDYLLKPFSFDRFYKAVHKALDIYELRRGAADNEISASNINDHVMIKVEYATIRVTINDIIFIEGLKDYIKIYTADKNYVTKSTMKNIEERLPSELFMRIHKSFIINLHSFTSYENNIITIKDKRIPVGSGYRDEFIDYLNKYKL